MTKRVIFYDKGMGGHRLTIQTMIRDRLQPGDYTFKIVVSPDSENSLAFLGELARQERFDHCHMLTLHDCVEDFVAATEDIQWLEQAGISFSGTYYLFTLLSPHMLIVRPPYLWKAYSLLKRGLPLDPYTAKQVRAAAAVMRSRAMRTVTIPDERLSSRFRYPFWRNKLRLLPDPAVFSNGPSDCERARKELGWDKRVPVILMFGGMKYWKGLDILAEALSEKYSHVYRCPFRVILAGQQVEKRPDLPLSHTVALIEFDHYIENDTAKKLFAAADCVVIPYKRYFEWSSGTFSLACASGKFIIAPDSGILGWRVKRFRNGLVYHPDRPASLAGAISRFIDIYPALSYPIEGSVRYAATCTPERYVRVLDEVIRDSLDRAG